jgi:hypothetical protein
VRLGEPRLEPAVGAALLALQAEGFELNEAFLTCLQASYETRRTGALLKP